MNLGGPNFPTHPGGMADNSPTFQRWEPTVNGVRVPKGRLTVHDVSRPFGTYCAWTPDPNVETLGYCQKSLRDKDLSGVCECYRRSNPSGIGQEACATPSTHRSKAADDSQPQRGCGL